MKRITSFLWLVFFLVHSALTQTNSQISGIITDKVTKKPLIGVNITIVGTTLGAASDDNGRYTIMNVPPEKYKIKASMIGYETVVRSILVSPEKTTKLNFSLRELQLAAPDVVISAEKLIERTSVSDIALGKRMLKTRHGLMEDPIRVIHTMPGVTFMGDMFTPSQIYIRGGGPDENLFLLDWVKLYWPWYFGGLKSVFNTDIVDKVELLTGGFPPKYGNALSSVLSVTTREGNRERVAGGVSLGFMNSQILLEGPLTSKGSYLVTGRRTYLDLLLGESAEFPVPTFYDLNFRVGYEPAAGQKIYINGFASKEHMNYITADPEPGMPDKIKTSGGLNTQSVEWSSIVNPNLYSKFFVLRADSRADVEVGANIDFDVKGKTLGVREDLAWNIQSLHELKTGFELTQTTYDLSGNLPLDISELDPTDSTAQLTSYDLSEKTWWVGGYLQDSWRVFPALTLTGGMRFDYLRFNRKTDLSPRFSLRYELSEKTALRAAWGRYYQIPELEYLSREPTLQSKMATHYIVGVDRKFNDDFHGWIEFYQKDYENLVVVDSLEQYSNDGTGYSRGVEFFLQKKLGSLTGWFSYAISKAKRREYLDLKEYDFDFDQRHLSTITLTYNFPEPEERKWYKPATFALTFRYASGRPYTPIVTAVQEQTGWKPIRGETNSERYTSFHNLNLRLEWNFTIGKKISGKSFFEIWNVYNRRNMLGHTYRYGSQYPNNVKAQPYYTISILPAGGFSIEF